MKRIIDFLIAPRGKCMGCGALTGSDDNWLCAECYGSLKPLYTQKNAAGVICAHCGTVYFGGGFCTGCRRKNVRLLNAPAAFVYDGPVREIIHNFKFKGTYRMADYMADCMKKALETEEIEGVDLIVPVPLHKSRLLVRGYNQSEKLAKALETLLNVPMENALERTRFTKSQSSLNGTQRRVNLDGAFRADERVKDKSILLIDSSPGGDQKCYQARGGGNKKEALVTSCYQYPRMNICGSISIKLDYSPHEPLLSLT